MELPPPVVGADGTEASARALLRVELEGRKKYGAVEMGLCRWGNRERWAKRFPAAYRVFRPEEVDGNLFPRGVDGAGLLQVPEVWVD